MESYKVYRIHPGIGVARLGNSEGDDHFIGPEVPDFRFVPPPDGRYRNDRDRVRRQGARFRIYEHTYGRPGDREPLAVREITAGEAEIRWSVQLANRKSYFPDTQTRFPNAPGAREVSGPGQKVEVHGAVADVPVQLGTLLTDEAGRLVVLGGFGKSGPFHRDAGEPNGIHNAGWYDDTSDGPVRATIQLRGTDRPVEAEPAWVLCGVPRYAAPVDCVVTLYDLAWDVAARRHGWPPPDRVSFLRDIYPVLFRTVLAQWVSSAAQSGHGPGQRGNFLKPGLFDLLKSNSTAPEPLRVRRGVFGKLSRPGGGGGNMPLLNFLSLTPTQYQRFSRWAEGDFVPDWPEGCPPGDPPPHKPFEDLTPWEQTVALDRAGLETTIGGSFNPGIEAGRIMADLEDPSIYEMPLRIARGLPPGTLTASLSIPWQADFNLCSQSWWPSARPGQVTQDGSTFYRWVPWEGSATGNREMVEHWWEFGFLARGEGLADPVYVETERLLPIPTGFDLGEPPMAEDKLATVAEAEAFARGLVEKALAAPLRSPQ